ncbi:MAG: YggS family pyridoxal phosphate-dependent enzyme [Cyclobacteriaceae bacterium]
MNSIKERLTTVKDTLPDMCTLVAVSKTKPIEDIKEAYDCGQRHFGENKVQELVAKAPEFSDDIKWHMIGHLQRNKVKYIAPFVHLIHGVDSLKLLKEINKQGEKNGRIIDCLLQVHIATEETKFGFDEEELKLTLESPELSDLKHVRVVGLMGMATNTPQESIVSAEFRKLKETYDSLQKKSTHPNVELVVLSMGMSGDYKIAIKEGSTMVRIGSSIFGHRN